MTNDEFINKFWPYAKEIQRRYKIPAETALAQAALESGWGNSAPGYMLFGIKATSSWNGQKQLLTTTEYHDNANVTGYPKILSIEKLSSGRYKYRVQTYFRKYNSYLESFDDYGKLLSGASRYQSAFNYKNDPYKFAKAIADAGYSTSSSYYTQVAKIIDDIKKKSRAISQRVGLQQLQAELC